MGLAQGTLCRDDIRKALVDAGIARRGRLPASLRPLIAGPVLGRGMGLSIVRHYPHLSERIQGLARGAGQSIESLMDLFLQGVGPAGQPGLCASAPAAARAGEGSFLLRSIGDADWVVRRSRPEVGFASVELTVPWMAPAVAGVNESGVAATLAPIEAASPLANAPPALLLVQECLQRFHDVAGCIDWCSKRPVSGVAAILVADASGNAAVIGIDGDTRQVVEASDGVRVGGGRPEGHLELLKDVESASSPGDVASLPEGTRVVVVPGERALRLLGEDGAAAQVFSVD